MNTTNDQDSALAAAKQHFISEWGMLGSKWGVTKTMGQVHALLMVADTPLNADQIMDELQISRGNVHASIKELLQWGLIRGKVLRGQRKDHFEAEKDVWKVTSLIAKERKKREVDPVLACLEKVLADTSRSKSKEAKAFKSQIKALQKYAKIGSNVLTRIGSMEESKIVSWIVKLIGKA